MEFLKAPWGSCTVQSFARAVLSSLEAGPTCSSFMPSFAAHSWYCTWNSYVSSSSSAPHTSLVRLALHAYPNIYHVPCPYLMCVYACTNVHQTSCKACILCPALTLPPQHACASTHTPREDEPWVSEEDAPMSSMPLTLASPSLLMLNV